MTHLLEDLVWLWGLLKRGLYIILTKGMVVVSLSAVRGIGGLL